MVWWQTWAEGVAHYGLSLLRRARFPSIQCLLKNYLPSRLGAVSTSFCAVAPFSPLPRTIDCAGREWYYQTYVRCKFSAACANACSECYHFHLGKDLHCTRGSIGEEDILSPSSLAAQSRFCLWILFHFHTQQSSRPKDPSQLLGSQLG